MHSNQNKPNKKLKYLIKKASLNQKVRNALLQQSVNKSELRDRWLEDLTTASLLNPSGNQGFRLEDWIPESYLDDQFLNAS